MTCKTFSLLHSTFTVDEDILWPALFKHAGPKLQIIFKHVGAIYGGRGKHAGD
jgi:hypothetical protein